MDYSNLLDFASNIWGIAFGAGLVIAAAGLISAMRSGGAQTLYAIVTTLFIVGLMATFPDITEATGQELFSFGEETRNELTQELDQWLQSTKKGDNAEEGSWAENAINVAKNLTPENIVKQIYVWLTGIFIWASQVIRSGYIYLQQFLILVGVTMSPLLISMFAWQPLSSYAWNFVFTMLALLLWPVAWLFADAFVLLALSPWLETLGTSSLLEASATALGAFYASIALLTGIFTLQTFSISLIHYFMRGYASSAPGTGFRFGGIGNIGGGGAGGKAALATAGAATLGAAAVGTATSMGSGGSPAASPAASPATASTAASSSPAGTSPAGGSTGGLPAGGSSQNVASTESPAAAGMATGEGNTGASMAGGGGSGARSAWQTPWASESAPAAVSGSSEAASSQAFSHALGSRSRPTGS